MILANVASSSTVAHRISNTIRIARVIAILGVVYVHAWTGLTMTDLAQTDNTPQGWLRWTLIDLLGRNAVPLLAGISGWLVMGSLGKRSWGIYLRDKVRTILVPMVLWNAIAILLVCGAGYAGWILAPWPNLGWTLNELFCLAWPDDINVQMWFLRDLFVCVLAAPLLVRLPSWALAALGAITLGWVITALSFPLLLRPQILLFFIVGLLVRRHQDGAVWLASRPIFFSLGAFLAAAGLKLWFDTAAPALAAAHPMGLVTLDTGMRALAAWFYWSLAWRLTMNRVAPVVLWAEPYMFLLYCSHLIMLWLGGAALGRLTGPIGAPYYPVYLLLQPVLVLLATIVLGRLLLAVSAPMANLLSGGRLGTSKHLSPLPPLAPSAPSEMPSRRRVAAVGQR